MNNAGHSIRKCVRRVRGGDGVWETFNFFLGAAWKSWIFWEGYGGRWDEHLPPITVKEGFFGVGNLLPGHFINHTGAVL